MEVKEYDVEVVRISYASKTIRVKATSEKEAMEYAIDESLNHEFSEHDADYKVEGVSKVK